MSTLVSMYIYRHEDGEITCSIDTTTEAHKLGVLRATHHWTAVPVGDAEGSDPVPMAAALACAAMGSRLLRLASEIHAQQPLFHVRRMDGVDA